VKNVELCARRLARLGGIDVAQHSCGDRHAGAGALEVVPQRVEKSVQGMLAGRVRRHLGQAHATGQARNDDETAGRLAKLGQGELCRVNVTKCVDSKQASEQTKSPLDVLPTLVHALDVVQHEHVKPPTEALHPLLDQLAAARLRGQV